MKVSVVMLAHNHEKYVGQALESAVTQETDFPFEVVVGEDCSTDRTPEIIRSYAEKYPNIVRPLFREKNLGMQRNNIDTFQHCQGEYIAILDSDDFWTSPHKLAKQVALMDSGPAFVLGFHRANVLYEDGRPTHVIPGNPVPEPTLENLLVMNFVPSLSTMYRRSALPEFPDWYTQVWTYDWPLHVMVLSPGGKIAFLDEVLATYRVHATNIWASQSDRLRLQREIEAYERVVEYVPEKYKSKARYGMMRRLYDLANSYRKEGQKEMARSTYERALTLQSKGHTMPLRRKLRFQLQMLRAQSSPRPR